jgi:HPt (histidine-containing phosphotransfer) domain-containing protein
MARVMNKSSFELRGVQGLGQGTAPDDRTRKNQAVCTDRCMSGNDVPQDPPLDLACLLKEFEDDRQFLMKLMKGFLDTTRERIPAIREAILQGDALLVRKEAHAIKGGAALLAAGILSGMALNLESMAGANDLDRAMEALDRLDKEFLRLDAFSRTISDAEVSGQGNEGGSVGIHFCHTRG